MLPAPRRRSLPEGRLALPLQRLFLLGQCFRSLQVMLQGRQRVLCEIGERALRLRFFLVFRDVLLMIRDHRLYELLIELGAGKLAETIVHAFLGRTGLLGRGDA